MTRYAEAGTRAEQQALLDELILAWAETSGMLSFAERIEGKYQLVGYNFGEDLHTALALEAFTGTYVVRLPDDKKSWENQSLQNGLSISSNSGGLPTINFTLNPGARQALLDQYSVLSDHIFYSLALETRLKDAYDLIDMNFNLDTYNLTMDFSRVEEYFADRLAAEAGLALEDLIDFCRAINIQLTEFAHNGFDMAYRLIDTFKDIPGFVAILEAEGIMNSNGSADSDFIIGGQGDDTISGGDSDDYLYGGDGDDKLYGGNGDDVLNGGNGDDQLYGDYGDDVLDGGAGNDYLEGGRGNDVFIFGRGYGHDTVNAYDSVQSKRDVIRLVGLSPADILVNTVYVSGVYHNLVITIKDTGETLTLLNGVSNYNGSHLQ